MVGVRRRETKSRLSNQSEYVHLNHAFPRLTVDGRDVIRRAASIDVVTSNKRLPKYNCSALKYSSRDSVSDSNIRII